MKISILMLVQSRSISKNIDPTIGSLVKLGGGGAGPPLGFFFNIF